ncbi:MAG: serine protease [Candidatus Moranbacteria bacterium]|nr:serine protease [Candidatus Moranbacteria bacterium]
MTYNRYKKFFFFLSVALAGFVFLGIVNVFFSCYIFPKLATIPFFSDLDVFRKMTERVTVINKTEQVVVREDDSPEKIASQPATAMVRMVTLFDGQKGTILEPLVQTGVLLTNDGMLAIYEENSSIREGSRYQVILFDGSQQEAEFVGRDSLIRVNFFRLRERMNTPAMAFANSDDVRVGKKVMLLQSTETEYQNHFTTGMIGAFDKTFNLSAKTVSFSDNWEGVFRVYGSEADSFAGGAAIGFNGEMIGLIGSFVVDNKMETFIIPSNILRDSLQQAIDGMLADRPVLGLYYLPITKTLKLSLGLSRDRGALVYSPSGKTGLALLVDSKAARVGFMAGDIIMAINESEVDVDHPLPKLLHGLKRGDNVVFTIWRHDKEERREMIW